MVDREKYRKDRTSQLGQPLSMSEKHVYHLIHSSGTTPITTEELHEQHYGVKPLKSYGKDPIYAVIDEVKRKLGKNAIINFRNTKHKAGGYLSRRALIEEEFPNSKRSSK